MLIALDYDGTYTADPELWDSFISKADKLGHQVMIVTMRYESEGLEHKPQVERVVFTGRKAKRQFMFDLGLCVQVWIDDQPDFILYGASS